MGLVMNMIQIRIKCDTAEIYRAWLIRWIICKAWESKSVTVSRQVKGSI